MSAALLVLSKNTDPRCVLQNARLNFYKIFLSVPDINKYFRLLPGNFTASSDTVCAMSIKMGWKATIKSMHYPNAFHFKNGTCLPAVVSPLQQLKLDSRPPLAGAPEAAYTASNCVGKGKHKLSRLFSLRVVHQSSGDFIV